MTLLPALLGTSSGCDGTPATTADAGADSGPVELDSAAAKYPDLRTLWSRAVERTCGPNSAVCHNNRQYPDMQTASGLLAAVNARCNQIRDSAAAIDNLCEPPGDTLRLGTFSTRIGSVTAMPATGPSVIVITLRDPLPDGARTPAAIVQQRGALAAITLPIPAMAIATARTGDRSVTLAFAPLAAAPGPVGSLADFLVPAAFNAVDTTQVQQGDPNGDGVFGDELGGALIKPGAPMKSYLLLRLLGPLAVGPGQMNTNVTAPASTEAQMPIANFQYWDVDHAVQALYCWISGMRPDGSNADGPIDYAHCDLAHAPSPTHQGGEATTWAAVYETILAPSCGGPCHHGGTTQPTTFFMDGAQATYDVLLGIRGSGPSETKAMLPFVTKNDPESSYLYLKLVGKNIEGAQMPLNASLPQSSIDDVANWIAQGANNN
jgi:hypothetical protein